MNVVMLLTNPCNPDVRVVKEAEYIVSKGHNVTILCWDRDKNSNLPTEDFIGKISLIRFHIPSVFGSGYKQLGAFLEYAKECRRYVKNHKVDIFHCHDLDGYITYKLIKKKKVPYIWDMHENFLRGSGLKRKIKKNILENGITHSEKSLYVSQDVFNQFSSKAKEKMLLLRNYPDEKYLTKTDKTVSDVLRIGYHGVVRSQVPQFTALFEACKDMKNVRIDINGGGIDLPELKSLSKKYKNVYIHGPYDGFKDSSLLYKNTDILFCGYDVNNINYQGDTEVVKYYEAIITGTPMIMTKGLGMAEKIKKFDIGISVDTTNPKEIRMVIESIINNKEILIRWTDNMDKIADDFRWSKAVRILDMVY